MAEGQPPSTLSKTLIPPINGWNTKDPISRMDERYAIEAINYFSNGGTVDLRKGYRYYSKGIGSSKVESIFELAADGTRYLVTVDNTGKVWNSTVTGAATDISGGASLNTGVCQAVVFMNRLFIKAVTSGTDVYVWTGAGNIALAGYTGPSADDKALMNPAVYKNRLYFVGRGSKSFWYSGVDSVTGALTEYSLQSVFSLGGLLYFVGSTTKQGFADQNYFVAISDQGEVLLYQGLSPADASWSLIGHYYMPPPNGTRAFFYWGASLVIITYQGIVLLSDVLQADSKQTFLSENINDQFLDVTVGSDYVCGAYYAKGNLLIINFETAANALIQFVYNTISQSWWKWTGITAYHWNTYANDLYFGGSSGRAFKADNGYFDENPASEGAVLNHSAKLRFAYNYLDNTETIKQPHQAVPILYESEGLSLTADANVDFEDTAATSLNEDLVDTAYKLYRPTIGLKPYPGKAVSIRFDDTISTKRRSIQAVEIFWKPGGVR